MATKRHVYEAPKSDGETIRKVEAFAKKWGYAKREAELYLMDYALRRLDVLARNRAKGESKSKSSKSKKAKAA